jgi:ATP-dependent Lhr-like helicase
VAAAAAAEDVDVRQQLQGGKWLADLQRMLGVLYRAQNPDDPLQVAPSRLVQGLQDLTTDPVVVEVVERHAELLVAANVAAMTWDLAERAYADSWAAALRHAVLQTVPDADDTDLIVDVTSPPDGDDAVRLIVSETSVGGLGLIEDLRMAYSRDPAAFWSALAAAVQPSDYEQLDASLRRLLRELDEHPDGPCAEAATAFRNAAGALEADHALHELIEAWTALDGPPRHLAVSAYSSRFLRPGADASTERTALALLDAWDDLEARIGAEVDARVIAYAATRGVLGGIGQLHGMTADQIFSLLWPRGIAARNHHLDHWQPFAEGQLIDRQLLGVVVTSPAPQLDVADDDWPSRLQSVLAEVNDVDLVAPAGRRDLLGAAIRQVPAIPIDRGPLRVFARLGRVQASGPRPSARCSVAEVYQ